MTLRENESMGKTEYDYFRGWVWKKRNTISSFSCRGEKVEMIYHFFPKMVSFFFDFSGKKTWAEDNGWMN